MTFAIEYYQTKGFNFRAFKVWYLNEPDRSDPENLVRVFVVQILWLVLRIRWEVSATAGQEDSPQPRPQAVAKGV